MDAFETTPLDGMALSGQDPLMGSIWNSTAALDSNAGLTGVLNTMQPTASRSAFTPKLEEPLPTVAAQSEYDSATKLFSCSTPANEWNNTLLNQNSLTGIAEEAAIAGSDDSDFLVEDVTSVNGETVLNLAVVTAQEQLESFATDEAFLDKMNLAFGEDIRAKEAHALTQDLANGEAMPEIAVLPAADLKANGAFGEETIYLSEKFLSENIINPEAVAGVLLEEIGHYVDQELGSGDSPGDEGDIFARLAQGEAIGGAELAALKAESDSATIALNGAEIAVELDASEPAPLEPVSIAAIDYQDTAPPDHLLKYEPGVPLVKDPAVEQWQQRMEDLGYDIDVDGFYGEQSKEVAIAFQQEKGLADDGVVGPDTWAATFSASEPAPLEPVSIAAIDYQDTAPPDHLLKYEPGAPLVKDPAVEQWQQRMEDLGYDIDVDGFYGPQSAAVARQFQDDRNLTYVDGIVGPETWEASFEPVPLEPVSIAAIDHSTESAPPELQLPQTSPDPSVVPQVGPPEMLTVTADIVPTRPLNSQELEIAKSVFGESINYDQVLIKEFEEEEWPYFDDLPAFTFGEAIITNGPIEDDTLIHELTHSWQYQQFGWTYAPGALIAQHTEGYDYGDVAELQSRQDAGQGITSFNLEQQAALVQDYYRLMEGDDAREDSNATRANLPVYAHFVDEVSTLSEPDLLPPDDLLYMRIL